MISGSKSSELTYLLERGGRLFRPGRTTESGRVAVGTIQAVIDGTRVAQLESRIVNTYNLEPVADEENVFVCRLFLQEESNERDDNKVRPSDILRR